MAKKTKPTTAPAAAPTPAGLPPEALAALGQKEDPPSRTLKSEGVGGIIAAGWRAAFRPGEHSLRVHMSAQFY
ncbi:hypothetical protein EMG21_29180, partial [Klebsiella pneumoniae]